MHAAFAGQARLLGGHAHAVCVGVDAGQILKDGQMTQPQLARHGHGEEEVATLAAGDEIHVHFARGFGHQVDQLTINRAGCKLLFDFAVDFVVKPELIARASLLDDGQQRVGCLFAAVEELGIDVERAELAGCIPKRLAFGTDANGVGFKQPRYDGFSMDNASLAELIFCYYKG